MSFFGVPGAAGSYGISGTYMIMNSKYESVDPGVGPDYPMLTIGEDGTISDAAIYDPAKVASTLNEHYKAK